MALFKRKTDSVLPEVDEYYQAERRDRGWLAWLLAFVSVAIVVLLIVGLFLGGRWAYNKIAGNDDADEVATTDNGGSDDGLTIDGEPTNEDGQSGGSDNNSGNGSSGADNDADDDTTGGAGNNNQNNAGSQGSGNQGGTSGNTNGTSSSSTSTPSTGDESGNLPNTGPADLAGIFVGVSSLAGGVHYVVTRKKQQ